MVASINVTNSVQQALNNIFSYLPNIIGFLVILVIGYIIAKIVRTIVTKVLQKVKVDQAVNKTPAGQAVDRLSPGGSPSKLIAAIVFWFIFLYVLTAAFGALKIPAVTAFINQVLAYLPNVIAAVIIFIIAAVISAGVVAVVRRTMGDTPTGRIAQAVAPGLVMVIAVFMILNQLKIAPTIVTITYAALLGMLALAGALAFGLGGRDVAARLVQQAYDNNQGALDQAKSDINTGKARAQQQIGPDGGDAERTRPLRAR
ncbi:MAG TPA: hypothetical protein VFP61_13850 [Acidimicrobiales bacterium]|nr:hypothetical protein [Acidimicrobiales bacterium]